MASLTSRRSSSTQQHSSLYSGSTIVRTALNTFLLKSSAWLYGWTPMILLVSYCIVSFAFYSLIPPLAHQIIWFIFVGLQTFTSLSVSTEAMQAVRPAITSRRAMRKVEKEGWPAKLENGQEWPPIDVILVAYLPNEQEIIMKQVRYALTKIDYPADKLTINVVYNTPKPIEKVERELRELEAQHRKLLRVVKVPKSTSKADNINHFLTLPGTKGQIITLYDTDHYPDPNALRWVAKRFATGDVDIIQGRCCIYNYDQTWITRLIAAEFDMIYGVMHAGRAELQGYGFFGGSNGHWNASLLRTLGMQRHMLTEDIDSSMRAIISGARIEYDLKVLSYELAPETLSAFNKQRMRWAQGWTQVAIRHFVPAFRRGAYSDNNGWRSRMGLLQLLAYREVYFYINSQLTFILLSGILTTIPVLGINQFFTNFGGYSLSMWAMGINLICLFVCFSIVARNRSHFTRWPGIVLFGLVTPFYHSGVSLMAIFCHFRELIKFEKWNPTKRKNK